MNRKADLEIVMRYLQWWDPMKVIEDLVESGNLLNEYDSYAREIHELLESKAGVFKLVATLEDIQLNRMTLQKTDKQRDQKFAEGLIQCYSDNEDLFY